MTEARTRLSIPPVFDGRSFGLATRPALLIGDGDVDQLVEASGELA